METITAKQLFHHYHRLYHDLTNLYCQARTVNPFNGYPEIAKAIYRVGVLLEFWHDRAKKIEEERYYQGG